MLWMIVLLAGAMLLRGADQFTEHLGPAAIKLGLNSFALALLLAAAEPAERPQ